jgi:PAS domain S-box-containing protein
MTREITVESILHAGELLQCGPDTSVCEAAARMSERNCSSMLVMHEEKIVGIWTEHDALLMDLSDPAALALPISRVMSSPVKTLPAATTLGEAALRFKQEGIRHFIVVDETGRTMGLVTQTDVIKNQGVEFFVHLREVGSVMNRIPVVLPGDCTVADAARQIREHKHDAVVIESAERMGILTERDIVRLIGQKRVACRVEEVAAFPLITVNADSSLYSAGSIFSEKRIRHLGVLGRNNQLVGLIAYSDLLASIEQDYVRELQIALRAQEYKLQESQQRLQAVEKVSLDSEEKYLGIFRNIADPVFLIRVEEAGRFVFEEVNPAFEKVVSLSQEHIRGKAPEQLFSAEMCAYFSNNFRACQSSVAPISYEEHLFIDGGESYWMTTLAPVRVENGQVLRMLGIAREITQRKRMELALAENEKNLKRLNETLEQRVAEEVEKNMAQERLLIQQSRLAAMGEMIGNIAHQWRQPLNALGLILANIKDAHQFNELDAALIEKSAAKGRQLVEKMSSTIDDFRNFFRPNKEKSAFSLNEAVREALEILSASFKNHSVRINLRADDEIIAWGFSNEYSQVLLNILNNAKEAIAVSKARNGEIRIHIGRDGKFATVTVSDNGGGMAGDVLPKIFDPYFTTKEKGTGIGLYMSKMIIENNMDGNITARNIEGGAEFTVACPLAE